MIMRSRRIQYGPDPDAGSGGNQTSNNAGSGNGFFSFLNELLPFLGQAIPLGLGTYAALQNPNEYMSQQTALQKQQMEQQAAQQKQQFWIFGGIFALIFIMMMVFIFSKKK